MEAETINPIFGPCDCNTPICQTKINRLIGVPLFVHSLDCIPDIDIAKVKSLWPDASEVQLRYQLSLLRWTNPICDYCWDKKNPAALVPCTACGLAFYCSAECRQNDVDHSRRCQRKDGPLDAGPQQLVQSKIKKSE